MGGKPSKKRLIKRIRDKSNTGQYGEVSHASADLLALWVRYDKGNNGMLGKERAEQFFTDLYVTVVPKSRSKKERRIKVDTVTGWVRVFQWSREGLSIAVFSGAMEELVQCSLPKTPIELLPSPAEVIVSIDAALRRSKTPSASASRARSRSHGSSTSAMSNSAYGSFARPSSLGPSASRDHPSDHTTPQSAVAVLVHDNDNNNATEPLTVHVGADVSPLRFAARLTARRKRSTTNPSARAAARGSQRSKSRDSSRRATQQTTQENHSVTHSLDSSRRVSPASPDEALSHRGRSVADQFGDSQSERDKQTESEKEAAAPPLENERNKGGEATQPQNNDGDRSGEQLDEEDVVVPPQELTIDERLARRIEAPRAERLASLDEELTKRGCRASSPEGRSQRTPLKRSASKPRPRVKGRRSSNSSHKGRRVRRNSEHLPRGRNARAGGTQAPRSRPGSRPGSRKKSASSSSILSTKNRVPRRGSRGGQGADNSMLPTGRRQKTGVPGRTWADRQPLNEEQDDATAAAACSAASLYPASDDDERGMPETSSIQKPETSNLNLSMVSRQQRAWALAHSEGVALSTSSQTTADDTARSPSERRDPTTDDARPQRRPRQGRPRKGRKIAAEDKEAWVEAVKRRAQMAPKVNEARTSRRALLDELVASHTGRERNANKKELAHISQRNSQPPSSKVKLDPQFEMLGQWAT